jgi:hypothetical protein
MSFGDFELHAHSYKCGLYRISVTDTKGVLTVPSVSKTISSGILKASATRIGKQAE